ncbi:MAG: phytase, partial [Alcanivorax sp.]
GADQGVAAEQVIAKGENLEADIEGLSLYRRGDQEYLVISSQGNNSYVLVDAQPPYAYRGRFRIGMDPEAGIDGASETDGLAVTSADLGGAFSDGLLVVQDGRNRLPDAPQNFKLVPWHAIDATLGLSESR